MRLRSSVPLSGGVDVVWGSGGAGVTQLRLITARRAMRHRRRENDRQHRARHLPARVYVRRYWRTALQGNAASHVTP